MTPHPDPDSNVIAFPDKREVCATCLFGCIAADQKWCGEHERYVPFDFTCPDWRARR